MTTMTTNSLIAVFLIASSTDTTIASSIIKMNNNQIATQVSSKQNNNLGIKYDNIYKKLDSYSRLEANWDGYGAVKPSSDIIETTKSFLDILKENKIIKPKIMIAHDGTLSLFWKNKNNYLEIDFDSNDHLSFFYEIDRKVYGEDDISIDKHIPKQIYYALNILRNENNTSNNITLDKKNQTTSSSYLKTA